MSDILLDQQELIIDQQVGNDIQYQIDQCLPEIPLEEQYEEYNQVLNNQQDDYPSQPMKYIPPPDSQEYIVQNNQKQSEQMRDQGQQVQQELVQNQLQQQEQIVQMQEPPEHIMIEYDQENDDSQPHVVECQKPAIKTFIFNKHVTNPKHWRLMMRPHAKVHKRNYNHNYRIDVLGKKLSKQIKRKSANDQLNWIFQKLKYESGIKFNNYTRKIRVITPISNTKYMHYQKKLQVMKKIRALLTIKLNIEGQRQDALEPVSQSEQSYSSNIKCQSNQAKQKREKITVVARKTYKWKQILVTCQPKSCWNFYIIQKARQTTYVTIASQFIKAVQSNDTSNQQTLNSNGNTIEQLNLFT